MEASKKKDAKVNEEETNLEEVEEVVEEEEDQKEEEEEDTEEAEEEAPIIALSLRKSKRGADKKGKTKVVYPKNLNKEKNLSRIDEVPRRKRKLLEASSVATKKVKVHLSLFELSFQFSYLLLNSSITSFTFLIQASESKIARSKPQSKALIKILTKVLMTPLPPPPPQNLLLRWLPSWFLMPHLKHLKKDLPL